MDEHINRRKVLKGLGAAGITGLSGCVGGSGGGDDDGGTTVGSSGGGSEGVIKIGTNYPLSGSLALFGRDATRGVVLMVENINNNGGINGKKIKLTKKDAKNTDVAVSNVQSLATEENVDAIFGSFSSSIAKASTQAAARYNVLYWETTGFSPQISEPGYQHLYHCNTRTTQYGQRGGEIIDSVIAPQLEKQTNQLRIGILYENGVFGTSTKNIVKQQAKQFGYNVVETIGYPPFETSDLSSAITKLKRSNLDVLYHSGYNQDTNLLWKQAASLGFYVPAVVGNGTAYVVDSFIEAVGDETALGIINVDQPHYNVSPQFASGMEEILTAYRNKYGKNPVTQLPATTYTCTQMFKQVASKAKSFEIGPFEKAALSVKMPLGSLANGWGLKFSSQKHRNQNVSVAGTQWQYDKFTKDIYHPKAHPNKLDVYGVYPKKAKVSYTDIKNIPRPNYTN